MLLLVEEKNMENTLVSVKKRRLTVGAGREPWQLREELDADRVRAASVSPGPGPEAHCWRWHEIEEEEEEEGDAECEEA